LFFISFSSIVELGTTGDRTIDTQEYRAKKSLLL
jgi:hypothetical protein